MKGVLIATMSEKELEQMDFFVKIDMWLVEHYGKDLFEKFGVEIKPAPENEDDYEQIGKLMDMFHKIYDEENKKYPRKWYEYGFGR